MAGEEKESLEAKDAAAYREIDTITGHHDTEMKEAFKNPLGDSLKGETSKGTNHSQQGGASSNKESGLLDNLLEKLRRGKKPSKSKGTKTREKPHEKKTKSRVRNIGEPRSLEEQKARARKVRAYDSKGKVLKDSHGKDIVTELPEGAQSRREIARANRMKRQGLDTWHGRAKVKIKEGISEKLPFASKSTKSAMLKGDRAAKLALAKETAKKTVAKSVTEEATKKAATGASVVEGAAKGGFMQGAKKLIGGVAAVIGAGSLLTDAKEAYDKGDYVTMLAKGGVGAALGAGAAIVLAGGGWTVAAAAGVGAAGLGVWDYLKSGPDEDKSDWVKNLEGLQRDANANETLKNTVEGAVEKTSAFANRHLSENTINVSKNVLNEIGQGCKTVEGYIDQAINYGITKATEVVSSDTARNTAKTAGEYTQRAFKGFSQAVDKVTGNGLTPGLAQG